MDERTDYERQLRFKSAITTMGKHIMQCSIPVQDRVTRCACDLVRLLNDRDCQPLLLFHDQEPAGRIVCASTYVDDRFDSTGQNLDADVVRGTYWLSQLSKSMGKDKVAPGAIRDEHSVLVHLFSEPKAERIIPTGIVDWKYEDELTLMVEHNNESFYAICPPGNLYAQEPSVRYEVSRMLRQRG